MLSGQLLPGQLLPGRECGFPRTLRLRKRREFLAVQDGPAWRVRTGTFLLLATRALEGATSRLGVVASRRLGGAVVRNRAKRLVREAFRLTRGDMPSGLDVVVIVGPGIRGRGLADVARDFARAHRDLARLSRSVAAPPARR